MCRRFEKIAEQRSRIPPLAKKSVTSSCQSSDGWMLEKTVKWSVGEGRRHLVTTRKASFKTLYINQVRALPEQMKFQYSAVEWTKNKKAPSDVLASLRPQVKSVTGHAKKNFCAMANGGDKTSIICLVLPQDKSELNTLK